MEEDGRKVTKRFLRGGNQVVDEAYIATSSSSDLLQAALRCNSDVQFMDRAVPADLQHPCEGGEAVDEHGERPPAE